MAGRTITLLSDEQSRAEAQRLATDVLASWPAFSDTPAVHALPLRESLVDPDRITGAAALAVVSDLQGSGIQQLIDFLEPRLMPLVIIAPADGRTHTPVGQGVLLAPLTAPPSAVAAMLHTLLQRQPLIEELQAEIRMNQRFQGGLRQEMSKMHEEMQLAGRVQREFLPSSLPTIDGLEFEVLFRPCGYVSGDIYDVVRIDEHRAAFALADAVGHGVPAALMTMVLTRALPIIATGGETKDFIQPSEALTRLNEALIRGQAGTGRFATAVYGVIDARSREVTLAGAGHPPPLRLGPGGVRQIRSEGPLLGVFPEADFEQVSFSLDEDEILLIYSDGFETAFPGHGEEELEKRMPSEEFMNYFSDVADRRLEVGLRRAMRRLGDAVDHQSGSLHQVDDLTAMAVAPAPVQGVGLEDVAARSAA